MPLKVDGKYDNPTADEVFIFDDCKQKIVFMCDGSSVNIVHIYDEDDEYDCDCSEECECCNCDGNDIYGFTVNTVKNIIDSDTLKTGVNMLNGLLSGKDKDRFCACREIHDSK